MGSKYSSDNLILRFPAKEDKLFGIIFEVTTTSHVTQLTHVLWGQSIMCTTCSIKALTKHIFLPYDSITLLNGQLSFCGPSKYNNGMLEKLRVETHLQTKLSGSHCYIPRAHIAKAFFERAFKYDILYEWESNGLNVCGGFWA